LGEYVWACTAQGDHAKVEKIVELARRASSTLESNAAVARLMILRHAAKDAEADSLERELLGKCLVETPNARRLDPRLYDELGGDAGFGGAGWRRPSSYRSYSYGYSNPYSSYSGGSYGWQGGSGSTSDLATVASLAAAVGVRFDPRVASDDLTVAEIRAAYQRHGLHAHAARLLERELADATAARDRVSLMSVRAAELARAGDATGARRVAIEAESVLKKELTNAPDDPGLRARLAELYLSRGYGPDYAKALEAVAATAKSEPSYDRSHRRAIGCLYNMGRYKEAFESWKLRAQSGDESLSDPSTIYQAAISACKGGAPAEGRVLARRALYRFPTHELAQAA